MGIKGKMSDLISRKESIQAINNLMESPYANDAHFGAERKETMEVVKVMCIQNLSTAFVLENVIEQLEEKILKAKNTLMSCIDENYAVRLRVKMATYEEIKEILKSAAKSDDLI